MTPDFNQRARAILADWFLTPDELAATELDDDEPLALPAPVGYNAERAVPRESTGVPERAALLERTVGGERQREDADLPPPTPAEPPSQPSAAANGFSRVLFAPRPFMCFKTGSGRLFESDSAAVIEIDGADDDDVKDLIRSGCREHQ